MQARISSYLTWSLWQTLAVEFNTVIFLFPFCLWSFLERSPTLLYSNCILSGSHFPKYINTVNNKPLIQTKSVHTFFYWKTFPHRLWLCTWTKHCKLSLSCSNLSCEKAPLKDFSSRNHSLHSSLTTKPQEIGLEDITTSLH